MNKRDRRMVWLTRPLPRPRIVRMFNEATGGGVACWLDSGDRMRGWYISKDHDGSQETAGFRGDGGWGMTEAIAHNFGHTLHSIRHALTAQEE